MPTARVQKQIKFIFRERFGSLEKSSIFAARFALFFLKRKGKTGNTKTIMK